MRENAEAAANVYISGTSLKVMFYHLGEKAFQNFVFSLRNQSPWP